MRRTKSNGNLVCLQRTQMGKHFRIKGRQKWYESVDQMQKDLDEYLVLYNTKRPHQGRGVNGRTPFQAFMDGLNQKDQTESSAAKKAA